MDDQRKDKIDPKGPKQWNRPEHLENNILPSDDAGNINSTNKEIAFLLANKRRIVSRGTERMLQTIQRHRRVTLLRSAHPQRKQEQTEKIYNGLYRLWKDIWYGPSKLDNKQPQNVEVLDEVLTFIEKTMKTWKVELTAGGRSLAEAKVQRRIFQGDALSPLQFIVAIMQLNHILNKCRAGYKMKI